VRHVSLVRLRQRRRRVGQRDDEALEIRVYRAVHQPGLDGTLGIQLAAALFGRKVMEPIICKVFVAG
jgi:hypothetical protein